MTTQNPPNCNITNTDGEFFSMKQDKYTTEISDNEKQKKIFYLGLGVNILFSIILFIVGFVLLKKNQTEMLTEQKSSEPLESPWTTGVIITLGVGVLCLLSIGFTGYKTYSLKKPVEKSVIDDTIRPCYSISKKEIVQPGPTVASSGIKSTITGSNLGKTITDQVLKGQTSISQSGLDQFDPSNIEITTGASQNTSSAGSGSQIAAIDTTGTGKSFTFNQDQSSMNTANAGSTSSGNQDKNTISGGNSSASSGTTGSSSVQILT